MDNLFLELWRTTQRDCSVPKYIQNLEGLISLVMLSVFCWSNSFEPHSNQDTAKCLAGEPMKRITLTYSHFSYVVTLDEHNIYIAKVKSD